MLSAFSGISHWNNLVFLVLDGLGLFLSLIFPCTLWGVWKLGVGACWVFCRWRLNVAHWVACVLNFMHKMLLPFFLLFPWRRQAITIWFVNDAFWVEGYLLCLPQASPEAWAAVAIAREVQSFSRREIAASQLAYWQDPTLLVVYASVCRKIQIMSCRYWRKKKKAEEIVVILTAVGIL